MVKTTLRRAVEEAYRLALNAFRPEGLGPKNLAAIDIDGYVTAVYLVGWKEGEDAWEVRLSDGGLLYRDRVADAYDCRAFAFFLLGERGRIHVAAGDATPADENRRFERFEAAGGIFGSYDLQRACAGL